MQAGQVGKQLMLVGRTFSTCSFRGSLGSPCPPLAAPELMARCRFDVTRLVEVSLTVVVAAMPSSLTLCSVSAS